MGRSRGVREERTEHTQLFPRTLAGSGLTWHQKVHFSTFDGKLELQCTRNGFKKPSIFPRVSPGHLYYLFLDISPTYFPKTLFEKKKTSSILEIRTIVQSKKSGSLTRAQLEGTPTPPTPRRRFHLMLWRSNLMLWRSQLLGVPI